MKPVKHISGKSFILTNHTHIYKADTAQCQTGHHPWAFSSNISNQISTLLKRLTKTKPVSPERSDMGLIKITQTMKPSLSGSQEIIYILLTHSTHSCSLLVGDQAKKFG